MRRVCMQPIRFHSIRFGLGRTVAGLKAHAQVAHEEGAVRHEWATGVGTQVDQGGGCRAVVGQGSRGLDHRCRAAQPDAGDGGHGWLELWCVFCAIEREQSEIGVNQTGLDVLRLVGIGVSLFIGADMRFETHNVFAVPLPSRTTSTKALVLRDFIRHSAKVGQKNIGLGELYHMGRAFGAGVSDRGIEAGRSRSLAKLDSYDEGRSKLRPDRVQMRRHGLLSWIWGRNASFSRSSDRNLNEFKKSSNAV